MRILTTSLAAAALLLGTSALSTPAFATGNGGYNPPNNNGCNNHCGDETTNNYDSHDTYNKGGTGVGVGIGIGKGGEGGQGGQGGQGGTGYGGNANNFNANIAKGGDAEVKNSGNSLNLNSQKNEIKDSGNSYNNIDNKDFNANINANKNEIKNSGNSEIKNSGNSFNANKNEQDQKQGQAQGQGQGQAQAVENVGNVHIENERPPVNTAYSAALATSEDTCMGSSSVGAQAVSFGLTLGTTWTDDNCQRLKNSRQLVALGYHRAATALMCFDESVKEAMIQAGTPCPSGAAAVYVAPAYVPPAREYVPMAPVQDEPVRKRRRIKKALPPK